MATTATGKRVLVYIRKSAKMAAVPAQFSGCLLSAVSPGVREEADCVSVCCELRDQKFILSEASLGPEPGHLLVHPPECPMVEMAEDPAAASGDIVDEDIASRGVAVGSVALLESSDGKVLLTRRAQHMRTFPGVWVPPGGGVEAGDAEMIDAAVRELREETGVAVGPEEGQAARIIGLWESVYPPFYSWGAPRRHHAVVYYHIGPVAKSSSELDREMVLQQEEVDASAWLSVRHAKIVVHGIQDGVNTNASSDTLTMKVVLDGEQKDVEVPATVLEAKAPQDGADVERVSSGTRFALLQWLKRKTLQDAKL